MPPYDAKVRCCTRQRHDLACFAVASIRSLPRCLFLHCCTPAAQARRALSKTGEIRDPLARSPSRPVSPQQAHQNGKAGSKRMGECRGAAQLRV